MSDEFGLAQMTLLGIQIGGIYGVAAVIVASTTAHNAS